MNSSKLPLTLGLFVAATLFCCDGVPAEEERFKVCADPNNPPFSTRDGKGFENKLAEMLSKDLGQQLEYFWFPQRLGFIRNTLKSRDPDTNQYKCDIVMGVPKGFELAGTTGAYYHSTYAMVFKKGLGLDSIKAPQEIDTIPEEVRAKLKIAMFDGTPATTWLLNHNLVAQAIPYQSMTGDVSVNTAQRLVKDFDDDKINFVIVWGPIAGYLQAQKPSEYTLIPMMSEKGLKFDFSISMGVRIPDKDRRDQLEALIPKNAVAIRALMNEYRIPLVDDHIPGEPTN
jgi:quinoprotein dehydrogenase-associated probable ABC transporter substrate-binding protein